ncbi:MAG: iron dependent repressor [Candidatus Methanoperedens nitroreducens]|uniref:Manganese transport regulator n=1 Tax=Candidatus Methanoperedens nitratireducens TaxID=1392998 RepID=A0A0P8A4X3_9EURY|nr:metal-dependent transcriptional regulator [Candidatus Methanoperedens sp. BLZ2]KAB2947725.1 MAG: metal-dependent transcriptional regulator [Candidatus Methanoperedens sp.]KPQ41556.1 MAG: iron dependent repressor [Candidatus Methanoperedens sp. BLZ1]MBZ0176212.1 metal-dependent transcriptional regulator [Candidatus Methanoperedens nitroreducens]MCX9077439.1 metal-dependent transcriptional regulator [Candidatus Methanoperedens sp.]MCX9089174.1 metal-dependent transcriptional regulator [Candid
MTKESPRIEEYLEYIYKLQEMHESATTSKLAQRLELAPSSVSEMLKQLEQKGLVEYAEKGVVLTKEGELKARKVIRKHRLSERLLTDILGFKWDKVHEEACRLEHDISSEMEDKIEEKLGNPRTCPHGYPIPDKEGLIVQDNTVKLSELKANEKGVIISVFEENSEMLQYLGSLGLYPEIEVKVKSVAPFGGPILIRVPGSEISVGKELAEKIMVQRK